MTASSAPAVGAPEAPPPPLAVRWRSSVERTTGESIHTVALIRLEPPPVGISSAAPFVEIRRACRYGAPFDVSVDLAEEDWLEAIEDALIETIKRDDQAVQRLHRDLDVSVTNVLDDPQRYGAYYRRLLDAVGAGRPRAEGTDAEAVDAIHRAFAAPWIGEAHGDVRIEYAVAPTTPRRPEAAPPAAALRQIPFVASLHGIEARELKPGMTIAPERNRLRVYTVTGVVEGSERGTVTIFCRAGGGGEAPADGAPADAAFTVASSVRVPLAGAPDAGEAPGDLFSNPVVFFGTAIVVLYALYVLVDWFLG